MWFNAWHHQNETHLFASLMEGIKSGSVAGLSLEGYVHFYWKLLVQRKVARRSIVFFCVMGASCVVFVLVLLFVIPISEKLWRYLALLEFPLIAVWLSGTRWNPLKAFAVSPSSLAKSSEAWIQFPRFRDRLSFRDRFGESFGQVCKAFGRRRLVIIVDDLDRCAAGRLVEVIEAINFLVSSGDCFVVLGIDEEQVRHAVGLHYREMAAEMGASGRDSESGEREREARGGESRGDGGGDGGRSAYATRYMEKLINLKIGVPSVDYEELTALRGRSEPWRG